MTFTEIVFEVADERYPLCKATATPSDALAVVRVLDGGRATGKLRTLISYYGTEAEAAEFPRTLRAYRSGGDLEVVANAPGSVTMRSDAPTLDSGEAPVRLMNVLKLVQGFGPDVVIEPFLVRRGRIRARVIVPRRIDTQRAILSLQDVQRSSGFSDFRVLRVSTLQAARYLDLLRRLLTPEQEELLRIASAMGYYDTPKGATLEDIARQVGLSVSPVHKRLKTIEELLVSAHVEPAQDSSGARARKRRIDVRIPSTCPVEVVLRVRWPQSNIAAFTKAVPGSRALIQVLTADTATSQSTFLLVILAPDTEYPRLLEQFAKRPDVINVETVEKDRIHASVKVHMRLASTPGAPTFPFWYQAWGSDATTRPFVFEDGDVMVRFLIFRPMSDQEVRQRLDMSAKLAGWIEYELISARPADDGRAPAAPPEPPTQRQEEVLKIAHALGYYRTPRACTLEQVAATLGVSANAIHKNLSSAEAKVIAGYLSAGI